MYRVRFRQDNLIIEVPENTTVLEAQRMAGYTPDAPCGGNGLCGKCLVDVICADGSQMTVKACEKKINCDITVCGTGGETGHRILSSGRTMEKIIKPLVHAVKLNVERPTLKSPTSNWIRLVEAVKTACGVTPKADIRIAGSLGRMLEDTDYAPEAVLLGGELIAVRKPSGKLYTAAVDIGTTTVVLYLIDANKGKTLATASMLNPQTAFGADVISRAGRATQGDLPALRDSIRRALDTLLGEACSKAGAERKDVFALIVAGNTCMHHLFLGIEPKSLIAAPYVPEIEEQLILDAGSLGITMGAGGKVITLPCIAGFVGADTAAVMCACGFDKREKLTLAIDIGTNGEMVLGNKYKRVCCSTAAGPAFEGAKIACGMRGAEGAIDHAEISDGELVYSVIGGGKPKGICGSGLMDITAEFLRAGIIDESGRFADAEDLPESLAKRMDRDGNVRIFVLAGGEESIDGEPVYISQKDIREVQLAKGAISAGIELMLKAMDAEKKDIDRVLIAGAFGNYMNPESACAIGLIPGELLDRIDAVGNAAGDGAVMCAGDAAALERTEKMAKETGFIELAAAPDFQELFVDMLEFPEAE